MTKRRLNSPDVSERVAIMEAGDPTVSADLLVRSLLATGAIVASSVRSLVLAFGKW